MRWVVSLPFLLLPACATPVDIDGRDYFVPFPALRATQKVNDVWSVDLDASWGHGSDTQHVSGGEVIVFEGRDFTGEVKSDLDLWSISVAGRARFVRDEGPFAFDGLAGVGVLVSDVKVQSGGVQSSDLTATFGPLFGLRLSYATSDRVSLYFQMAATLGVFGGELSSLGALDLGVEGRLAEHVSLFGGWRWWSYGEERGASSDIDYNLGGPVLGLSFDF